MKLLEAFTNLEKEKPGALKLVGDAILVEKIPEEEIKRTGGLFIPVSNTKTTENWRTATSLDKPALVRVLAVGEGYYNEDGDSVPLDIKPGNICLVGTISVLYFSTFGRLENYDLNTIGLTRESEVKAIFESDTSYDEVFQMLNTSLKV